MKSKEQIIAELPKMNLSGIAAAVRSDWQKNGVSKVYFGARPYLNAMLTMNDIKDNYGADSGVSIVTYFLCNAQTWRGEMAKAVKTELKARVKTAK